MKYEISKPNANVEFLNGLIDEIGINSHERIRAKARLAQGDAMANAMVGFFRLGKRLLKSVRQMSAGQRGEGKFPRIA